MAKFFDTWPKYVKTVENHSTGLYLVKSREELIELMVSTTERWFEDGDFGQKEWYTHASFEDFFASRMSGMSWETFNAHIRPLSDDNGTIRTLKESGMALVSKFSEINSYLEDLKFLEIIAGGKRPAGFANRLYAILRESEYDGKPRFVVDNFDSI